jgi:SAM-dependent methyltransferase
MMEAGYYEQAEIFDDEFLADPDAIAGRIATTIDLIPHASTSLLDVGAGDGRLAAAIGQRRADLALLVVTDRSLTGLSRSRAARVAASGDALPFPSGSFDVVTACEVLEHLPPSIFGATCAELGRVARHTVVVTVPNAERRKRSDLRCRECGCRYNRMRHLRSFSPQSLATLVPRFRMSRTFAFGPHPPVYPRAVRALAERLGVLHLPAHAVCPQCGAPAVAPKPSAQPSALRSLASPERYRRLRQLVPHSRRPYWLAAVYERT